MMGDMMAGACAGSGLIFPALVILTIVVLVLGAAALLKYLLSQRHSEERGG